MVHSVSFQRDMVVLKPTDIVSNIAISVISLYNNGSHTLVGQQTHCFWKGDKGNGRLYKDRASQDGQV